MNILLFNQILYPFFNLLILISILGYGYILNKFIALSDKFIDLKNFIFIQGLIFVSFFSIILNYFVPISNFITLLVIIIGSVIYLYYFYNLKSKNTEFIFLALVSVFSSFFSFYAGVSDDFIYHFETIKNFKNFNIFEISHHRMISYNSNWLFLNAVFSIDFFTSTIFILSSLLYAIFIYDTYNLYLKGLKNNNFYIGIVSFFILIFFIGVLNNYKDFGTDIPGVIISFYVLIIIIYFVLDKIVEDLNKSVILILLLVTFAFIIKITNSLIFLYLVTIIFSLTFKRINLAYLLFVVALPLLWFFQNYIISGCLIWPIQFTCFSNNELAIKEFYLIESFAKGDIATQINVSGFDWIFTWLINHSKKLVETYLVFILILLFPILYFLSKSKNSRKELFNFYKKAFINFNYFLLILGILISNLIWFLYAPAYRFGVFYNFTLITFLVLPFWIILTKNHFKFIFKYCKIIMALVFVYFLIVNISKFNWYLDRYEVWPPIKDSEVISRKIS